MGLAKRVVQGLQDIKGRIQAQISPGRLTSCQRDFVRCAVVQAYLLVRISSSILECEVYGEVCNCLVSVLVQEGRCPARAEVVVRDLWQDRDDGRSRVDPGSEDREHPDPRDVVCIVRKWFWRTTVLRLEG